MRMLLCINALYILADRMSGEQQQIDLLVRDIHRMLTLGTVHTIQVFFGQLDPSINWQLEDEFTDSLTTGLMHNETLYIEQVAGMNPHDLERILLRALELSQNNVEGISFYTELIFKNQSVFAVIEYNMESRSPELLSVDQKSLYFELNKVVQTKWMLSARYLM